MNDNQLKRAKKASAGLSIAGGTLGLAGLGALVAKKPETAAKLSIGATGIGGVGSYNYAAIQRAEAKKRGPKQQVFVVRNKRQIKDIRSGLQPVTKGLDMLDFGLGSVVQPGEISKRLTKKQEENVGNASAAGAVAAPTAAYFGRRAGTGAQMGYQASRLSNSSIPRSAAGGAKGAKTAVKIASGGEHIGAAFMGAKPLALSTAMIGGAVGAGAGARKYYENKNKKVAKAFVPKVRVHRGMTGFNGSKVDSITHGSVKNAFYRIEQGGVHRLSTKNGNQLMKVGGKASLTPLGREVRTATAVGIGAGAGYSGLKKISGKKQDKNVFKAYNPEDRRRRRLENTSTAMAAAGGAGIAAGGALGRKAVGSKPYDRPVKAGGKMGGGVVHNAGTGLRSEATGSFGFKRGLTASGFKGGLRTAGTGAALGLAGVGLAVGSDRVRNYGNKGKGRSYRPLHRNI